MNFTDAKQLMRNYLEKHFLGVANQDDIEALITHWLLNPDICPPCITKNAFNACRKLFGFPEWPTKHEFMLREESSPYQIKFDFVRDEIPYPVPEKPEFRFIDLFAGIGGFRIAFQNAGGQCVFTSEWDKHAKRWIIIYEYGNNIFI